MIKNITVVEIARELRKYKLLLENDAPLGELFDVLNEMRALVVAEVNKHVQATTPPTPDLAAQQAQTDAQKAPEPQA